MNVTVNLQEACERLIARYIVRPGANRDSHYDHDSEAPYVCVVHCDCPDHYYRRRDCKHVGAWLLLYDCRLVTV